MGADNKQRALNKLPRGERCVKEGDEAIKRATEHVTKSTKENDAAQNARVEFGSRTFSSVMNLETSKNCDGFYTMRSFKIAEQKSKDAQKVLKAAQTSLADAKKRKHECLCRTAGEHHAAWKKATNDKFDKAWQNAHKVSCVLEGKMTCPSKCQVPTAPVLKKPKLHTEVEKARPSCKGISATTAPAPAPTTPAKKKKMKVCPREKGFCVKADGADQNSDVKKVNSNKATHQPLRRSVSRSVWHTKGPLDARQSGTRATRAATSTLGQLPRGIMSATITAGSSANASLRLNLSTSRQEQVKTTTRHMVIQQHTSE